MSSGENRTKREECLAQVKKAIEDLQKCEAECAKAKQRDHTIASFRNLVADTTALGENLEQYKNEPLPRIPDIEPGLASWAQLSFCGFLEGDFSERSHFPISLFGGFFLRTPYGNILFDPGSGTRSGLREMGVNLKVETDAVVVSHYHSSVRSDLHLVMNELGAYPIRKKPRKNLIHFFSTRAVIAGRNGHPPLVMPLYEPVIQTHIVSREKAGSLTFRLTRQDKVCRVEGPDSGDSPEPKGGLLIRVFPAFHSEVADMAPLQDDVTPVVDEDNPVQDDDGLAGEQVSSFFIQAANWGIFYTGDTEYTEDLPGALAGIAGKVTVLVANMKTIEFRPKKDGKSAENPGDAGEPWHSLRLTKNQLGFEGLKRLALLLRPKVLVIRALGLECVVAKRENQIVFAPEKINQMRNALSLALADAGLAEVKIIIPARHEVFLSSLRGVLEWTHTELVPSTPPDEVTTFGGRFVTGNRKLIHDTRFFIDLLHRGKNPFMVIEGVSGVGKSHLAEAMAVELLQLIDTEEEKKSSGSAVRAKKKKRGESPGQRVNYFDLGTIEHNSANATNQLFGWPKKAFSPQDPGHPGLLAQENGILILNQLEKLPNTETRKFLDLLENWRYMRFKEQVPQQVKVKIIFTTNEKIDQLKDVTDDLKNRLRGRCLTIPDIESLPEEERRRELTLFILDWCTKEKAIIDVKGWALLLAADLSRGAIRCLRRILEIAKSLAEERMGIYQPKGDVAAATAVFLDVDAIQDAMTETGVACRPAGVV